MLYHAFLIHETRCNQLKPRLNPFKYPFYPYTFFRSRNAKAMNIYIRECFKERSLEREMSGVVGPRGAPGPGGSSHGMTASLLVATVVDLLAMNVKSGQLCDPTQLSQLCISLARGIDYAVANNEVPSRARDLPLLLIQVYQNNNDLYLKAALMVLMISVKNACKIGWFPEKDKLDLLALTKEIWGNFSDMDVINTEPSCALSNISKILSRFCPQIKMGHMLVSLEVKPGYRALVADFQILKNMVVPVQEQIGLFVADIDNMDTSSCVRTPPQVNFLLNGRGVQGRINNSMDNGPQLPTNVTAMLKYGVNVLQAVGKFNGHYIVVIAFLHVMSSSDIPVLQDYVQPVLGALDSDSEIIEGPSRVSLNCPISHRRIRTPVKGHLCKHYQCFDYENFMEINSRRPLWHCPYCNRSVCYPDIRIDQNIAKVLKEVGENVVDVTVLADGSWKAVLENEDHKDQMYHGTQRCQQERPQQCESIGLPYDPSDVVDLTREEANGSDSMGIFENTGRVPLQDNLPRVSVAGNLVPPEVNNTERVDQNTPTQIGENFWSRTLLSISSAPHGSADPPNLDNHTTEFPVDSTLSPVQTDSPSVSIQHFMDVHGMTQVPLSFPQNQVFNPSNSLLQQFRVESEIMTNENRRLPSLPRYASGTSISTQAFSPHAQDSGSCEQTGALNSSTPSGSFPTSYQSMPFVAPNNSGLNAINGRTEGGQQFPMLAGNSFSISHMASSSMQNHAFTQNRDVNDRPNVSAQSVQPVVSFPAQCPDAYSDLYRHPSGHSNPYHSNYPNLRMVQAMMQSRNMVHPSNHVQPMQFQQRAGGSQATDTVNNRQPQPRAAAQPMIQMSRTPLSAPVQLQASRTGTILSTAKRLGTAGEHRTMGRTPHQISRADALVTLTSTQNWQPSGRMRGSLTGDAYAAAHRQFMNQAVQPVQASQSPSTIHSASQAVAEPH